MEPSNWRKFNGVQFDLYAVTKYKKNANKIARMLKKQFGSTRIRIVPVKYKNYNWAVYVKD